MTVYVGMDYHRSGIQVCVVDREGRVLANQKVANQVSEVIRVAGRWGEVSGVAVESCCGAADLAERLLQATGWSIFLGHPGYVNRMKQNPEKSDHSDARLLADLVRVGYLPRVWLAPSWIRQLRELVRFRFQQVDRRRKVKVRILAILRNLRIVEPDARRWTRRWLAWLRQVDLAEASRWVIQRHLAELDHATQEIRGVEQHLTQFTADDATITRLRSNRGIGPVSAWVLRAEVGCFDRFRGGKQLSRFCGLSPRNASSGERVADAGLVRTGQRSLKATLIQVGHHLAQHDPHWTSFARRLRQAGKPTSVAIAAVANHWVRQLWHRMMEQPQPQTT